MSYICYWVSEIQLCWFNPYFTNLYGLFVFLDYVRSNIHNPVRIQTLNKLFLLLTHKHCKFELYELSLFILCTELIWSRLLFGCSNIKLDSIMLVLNKRRNNLIITNWGVQWFWWIPTSGIPQGSILGPLSFSNVQMLHHTAWTLTHCSVSNLSVCVCVMLSVGPSVRWPAHPPPVQHPASQVQEAVGPGEDPAHSLHGEPLHQGELWLPEDSRWRRPHSPRRFWRGLFVCL